MKKIILILAIVVITAFMLSRCGDVYISYALWINNQTNDTIEIRFSEDSPYTIVNPDSLFFPPKNLKLLWGVEGRSMKKGCDYTGIYQNQVEILTSSGRKLKKEIGNVNNWHCIGKRDTGWCQTFIIFEEDLE